MLGCIPVYADDTGGIEIIPVELSDEHQFIPETNSYPVTDSNALPRAITGIGAERVDKVDGKREYPASAVVKVEVVFESNQNKGKYCGTGALISKDTIITSAHLFFDKNNEMLKFSEIDVKTNCGEGVCTDVAGADKVYISSAYLKTKKSQIDNPDRWKNNLVELYDELTASDFAIIHIKKDLGSTYGWLALDTLGYTGGQKWGTLYQYPVVVPNLPDKHTLVAALKADAKDDSRVGTNAGIMIDVESAIWITKKDRDKLPEQYKNLFNSNIPDVNLYSSYYHIEYSRRHTDILDHELSAYGQSSGGPIITSKYNYSTGGYDSYICGIHSGYTGDMPPESFKKYADKSMYIKIISLIK